jgi:hypothetical protein
MPILHSRKNNIMKIMLAYSIGSSNDCLIPTTLTRTGHPFVEARAVRPGVVPEGCVEEGALLTWRKEMRGSVLDRRHRRPAEEEARFCIGIAVHFGAAEYW